MTIGIGSPDSSSFRLLEPDQERLEANLERFIARIPAFADECLARIRQTCAAVYITPGYPGDDLQRTAFM